MPPAPDPLPMSQATKVVLAVVAVSAVLAVALILNAALA